MTATTVLLVAGGLLLLLLIIGLVVSISSERSVVEDRLERYLADEKEVEEIRKQTEESFVREWLNRNVARTSFGERLSRELARADLKFKVGEFVILVLGIALAISLFTWILGGRDVVSWLIGLILGLILPNVYLKRRQATRLQKFNDQLADMLNLMVNGLRAGYSTMQAMEAVSRELPPPISDEFRRVVQEMQLGIPMEKALDNLLRRIPSDDLDFVVTAINVQREVGGNLSEILDTIAYTIRERVRIKGEIRVLTSQVRTSGQFISALPFLLMLVLWFVNRDYVMTFFEPENRVCGSIALAVAFFLVVIGYFVMMKIADIEV